jgi:N-acetylmuramoyl-L-alanine amidase
MNRALIAVVLMVAVLCGAAGGAAARATRGVVTICIDPGHPSEAGRGTRGEHITEIHAAWMVAIAMRDDLARMGATVVMTKRSENEFVTNRRRAEIANAAHADLMVRLHCDGGNGIGSGFAVYCPDRQGRADGGVGPSADVIARSQVAANAFYASMTRDLAGKLPARGLHPDTATRIGAKQGALTGSVFAKVPVVLVEMCVLTNPTDEAWISSKTGREDMAAALARASLAAAESDSARAAKAAAASRARSNRPISCSAGLRATRLGCPEGRFVL